MELLTITAAAQQAGVSVPTLRSYEKQGLLTPRRSSAGFRIYSPDDVQKARRIAARNRARMGYGLRGWRPEPGAAA